MPYPSGKGTTLRAWNHYRNRTVHRLPRVQPQSSWADPLWIRMGDRSFSFGCVYRSVQK